MMGHGRTQHNDLLHCFVGRQTQFRAGFDEEIRPGPGSLANDRGVVQVSPGGRISGGYPPFRCKNPLDPAPRTDLWHR